MTKHPNNMKKIINPFLKEGQEYGYNCFACAPHNPFGLKMEFYEDGDDVVSFWHPHTNFQGWVDTLHGGIQATLLDETAAWLISRKKQVSGMTTNLNVKYKKPIPTVEGTELEIRARIKETKRMFVIMEAEITCGGEVCTQAELTFYCFSKEKSEKEFNFRPYEVEE